jgi:hypothetical protein
MTSFLKLDLLRAHQAPWSARSAAGRSLIAGSSRRRLPLGPSPGYPITIRAAAVPKTYHGRRDETDLPVRVRRMHPPRRGEFVASSGLGDRAGERRAWNARAGAQLRDL